jgi:DNA-binding response OmpR family regulator
MENIMYFGGTPLNQALLGLLHDAGYKLLEFTADGLSRLGDSRFQAVLVDWNSLSDQAVVRAAKREGIPVVVMSHRVSEAFWPDKVIADIYLEKPVDAADIASALLEAIDECQNGIIGPNHGLVSVTNRQIASNLPALYASEEALG